MIRTLFISVIFVACTSATEQQSLTIEPATMENQSSDSTFSIHQFKVEALDGSLIDMSAFKGKKILIVNTASECGYTPQYKDLQKLYETYKDQLVVVGFPANNFGAQEPGSNATIQSFCSKNYGVTFPMAAKISVKGNDMAPIYQFLTQKKLNGVLDTEINWNFNKFLLNENGTIIQKFESKVNPMSPEITDLL